ncbi:hypothetical protein H4219_000726 [Mycoemilia scoparia]|uniref:Mitochondrial potassium channel ATP-binding subunit n=1 Tax=Mycoemilia scoparia TaxID=417184 RepID=A0A9W8ABF2_9FUNG|nr:hypothetical protein H4219_000726 [Mycoemilia scoparia]
MGDIILCDAPVDLYPDMGTRLSILKRQAQQFDKLKEKGDGHSHDPDSKSKDDQKEKKMDRLVTVISSIIRILGPEIWLFLAVTMTAVGAAVVNLWTPLVTGELVNGIASCLQDSSEHLDILDRLTKPAQKLLVLFAANGLLTFTHISLVTALGENIGKRLREELFAAILKQDIGFFDQYRSGELIARLTTDIADFKSTFKQVITQGLKAFTLTVGTAYHLIRISPPLTGALLLSMPALYLSLWAYGSFLRKLRNEGRVWESISSGVAGEAISNIRTVRAFAGENDELGLYSEACDGVVDVNNRFGFHMGVFRGMTNASIGVMVLIVLYYGGTLVSKGEMSPGNLMSFMISTQAAQRALDALGGMVGQTIKAIGSSGRVFELTLSEPAIPLTGGIKLDNLEGNIRFMNVDFSYPSRPKEQILSQFNLDIPAGQLIALCGHSGSGKSTVASLVERFYDPDEGEIWIDSYPLTKLDPKWLRSQIGFINQEPTLFASSIRENIRYGNPSATDEDVMNAARLANATEFIESFKDGYDTVLGERGATLSGGQRQRIAIARAILHNPRILILDEATSALDSQSEQLVQVAIDRLMQGRTVLVIAHRLSTIRNADRIVVMGRVPGQIIEHGTHDDLMNKKGAYYQLYNQSLKTQNSGIPHVHPFSWNKKTKSD